jgi:ADP-ribosylation factor-like protein 8
VPVDGVLCYFLGVVFVVFVGANLFLNGIPVSDNMDNSKKELHELLAKPPLAGIPVLVLGNKNDLPEAIGDQELIDALDLKAIEDREVCCYSISAKNSVNIDITLDWLIKHAATTG